MLGKAHLAIGMAAALTLAVPETLPAALPVITGAAAGSLICDIDCNSPSEQSDASRQRILAVIIAAAALVADRYMDGGMWLSLAERSAAGGIYLICAGIAGLVITLAFASISSHRGFSHSLLAMAIETACVYIILPQTAVPFAVAFATHLILDISNKKQVRLFYPAKKGVSLGLFYADRLANRVCEIGGTAWLILALIISLRQ